MPCPKDNPFVGKGDAKPEIWAYGSATPGASPSTRKDGTFWCADVGQDIWEEIDIIVKGGNYGGASAKACTNSARRGSEPRKDLIRAHLGIHHNVGKSITGG